MFNISSILFANKPLFSFLFFVDDIKDLKVSISPNTLAVSASVKGVDELKYVCFLDF